MRRWLTWIWLMGISPWLGCATPVPQESADYVGAWQGKNARLTIRASGTLDYERRASLGTVAFSGARFTIGADEIVVGLWPLTTVFHIDAAPHSDGNALKLTLDGTELTRVDERAPSDSTRDSAEAEHASRCREGDGEACAALAEQYGNGLGVPQDLDRAADFLNKACRAHVPKACQDLIGMFNAGQLPRDPDTETDLLSTACSDGHSDSCAYIATWYFQGTHPGVAQNLPLAFDFYTKGCAGNDPPSCHNLGVFYTQGIVVAADPNKAVSFHDKACGLDNFGSCNNLGVMYMGSEGVARDLKRALALFRKACTAGETDACGNATKVERGDF